MLLTMWVCVVRVAICVQGELELGVVQAQRSAAKAPGSQLGRYPVQRQHISLHLHVTGKCTSSAHSTEEIPWDQG